MRGQVVIITGASAGIGHATALAFARQGARLVLAARRRDRLAALASQLANAGAKVIYHDFDITQEDGRRRLVTKALEEFGRIDVLINNAGFGYRSPVEVTPISEIRANFETNVFAPIALTQLVIPVMRKQRQGCVVNVSSVAGKIARPLSSIYDATKHAIEAFSDGLRGELAPFGIRLLVVEPGFVETEFTDVATRASLQYYENQTEYQSLLESLRVREARLRRFAASPDEIAQLIVKAVCDRSSRMRYVAPRFALLSLTLKRFLPERLFQRLIGV